MIMEHVSPSDINISGEFYETFGKIEREIVARNVVVISQEGSNRWKPFTWEEYKKRCSHSVTWHEERDLDALVKSGHLLCNDGAYEVTDEFIVAVWKYVTKNEKITREATT